MFNKITPENVKKIDLIGQDDSFYLLKFCFTDGNVLFLKLERPESMQDWHAGLEDGDTSCLDDPNWGELAHNALLLDGGMFPSFENFLK